MWFKEALGDALTRTGREKILTKFHRKIQNFAIFGGPRQNLHSAQIFHANLDGPPKSHAKRRMKPIPTVPPKKNTPKSTPPNLNPKIPPNRPGHCSPGRCRRRPHSHAGPCALPLLQPLALSAVSASLTRSLPHGPTRLSLQPVGGVILVWLGLPP